VKKSLTFYNKGEKMSELNDFLDDESRIKTWPSKHAMKRSVVEYLGTKFEVDRVYTEKEVNEIIKRWHTFGDFFMLRRSLIDYKYLQRTRDGSEYRKIKQEV